MLKPKNPRCVATPGPRYELTVGCIDLPHVFEPEQVGLMREEFSVTFSRHELPEKLVGAYPELCEVVEGKNAEDLGVDYPPVQAIGVSAPSIFYLEEGPKTQARLVELFKLSEMRRTPDDLLIRGTPATLVVRPVRFACHCGGNHRKGVVLQLLAIKLAPHAMGLPTYQDFLDEEDKLFAEKVEAQGGDY